MEENIFTEAKAEKKKILKNATDLAQSKILNENEKKESIFDPNESKYEKKKDVKLNMSLMVEKLIGNKDEGKHPYDEKIEEEEKADSEDYGKLAFSGLFIDFDSNQQFVVENITIETDWLSKKYQTYEDYIQWIVSALRLANLMYEKKVKVPEDIKMIMPEIKSIRKHRIDINEDHNYLSKLTICTNLLPKYLLFERYQMLSFQKIGKKFGMVRKRKINLVNDAVMNSDPVIIQEKHKKGVGIEKKAFGTPLEVRLETKADHNKKLLNQKKFKDVFDWNSKDSADKPFRLILRFPDRRQPGAIYCNNLEQSNKIQNYLTCKRAINLFENIGGVFTNFSQTCNYKLCSTFRIFLKHYVKKKLDIKQKRENIMSCEILDYFNESTALNLINTWKEIAHKRKIENLHMEFKANDENYRNVRTKKFLDILNNNKIIKQYDKKLMLSLMASWRTEALNKLHENQEVFQKSIEINFVEIEIDSELDFLQPILNVRFEKSVEDDNFRVINEKVNQFQRKMFYSTKLFGKIMHKSKENFSYFSLHELSGIANYNEDSQCAILIKEFSLDDIIVFTLYDESDIDEDSNQAVGRLKFSDLIENDKEYAYKNLIFGKEMWLPLEIKSKDGQENFPAVHIEAMIKPAPEPFQFLKSFGEQVEFKLAHNKPLLDPVFHTTLSLPLFTPKNFKFAIGFIEESEDFDEGVKAKLLQEVTYENKLKLIKSMLYRVSIRNSCLHLVRSKKSKKALLNLEELLSRNDSSLSNINVAKIKKIPGCIELFEQLCMKGVPVFYRFTIWQLLCECNITKHLTQNLLKEYEGNNSYEKLLAISAKSESLQEQELFDDLNELSKLGGMVYLSQNQLQTLQKVMRAFICWMSLTNGKTKEKIPYCRVQVQLCVKLLALEQFSYLTSCELGNKPENGEEEMLWSLVSIISNLLHEYYKQSDPFCSSKMGGIKRDLYMLKLCVKDLYPKLHKYMLHFAVPLDFLFGECFLNIFSEILPNEIFFRLIDLLIFQRAFKSENLVSMTMISVAVTILGKCEHHLLASKSPGNWKLLLETNGKLIKDADTFIETVCSNIDKLKSLYNNSKNQLSLIQKELETHYHPQITLNTVLSAFIKDYSLELSEILKEIVKQKEKMSENKMARKPSLKTGFSLHHSSSKGGDIHPEMFEKIKYVHLFLHKLILFWSENSEILLEISYNKKAIEKITLTVDTCVFLNQYIQISFEGISEIEINIYEDVKNKAYQKDELKLIKRGVINLNSFHEDFLQKTIVHIEDIVNETQNLITSEIEVSLLLATQKAKNVSFGENVLPETVLGFIYNNYYSNKPGNFDLKAVQNDVKNTFHNSIVLANCGHAGLDFRKQGSAILSYEEFKDLLYSLKGKKDFNFDIGLLYKYLLDTSSKHNMLFDFFILLTLLSSSTFKQKSNFLFEILLLKEKTKNNTSQKIKLSSLFYLTNLIFRSLALYIPENKIENLVELNSFSKYSCVLSSKLISTDKNKIIDLSPILINYSNYMHFNFGTKDLFLGNPQKLYILQEIVRKNISEKELKEVFAEGQAILTIKYEFAQMKHKFKCLVNKEFAVVKRIVLDSRPEVPYKKPSEFKIIENLFFSNENTVPISDNKTMLSREEFIEFFSFMPLINYFLSFQNTEMKERGPISFEAMFKIFLEDNLSARILFKSNRIGDKCKVRPEDDSYGDSLFAINQIVIDNPFKIYESLKISIPVLEIHEIYLYDTMVTTMKKICEILINSILSSYLKWHDSIRNKKDKEFENINPNFMQINFMSPAYQISIEKMEEFDIKNYSFFDLITMLEMTTFTINIHFKLNKIGPNICIKNKKINSKFIDDYYDQLAIYRYSDHSTEWLPCRIINKFQKNKGKTTNDKNSCKFIGVAFKKFPYKIFLKKPNEIIMLNKFDVRELEEGKEEITRSFVKKFTSYGNFNPENEMNDIEKRFNLYETQFLS